MPTHQIAFLPHQNIDTDYDDDHYDEVMKMMMKRIKMTTTQGSIKLPSWTRKFWWWSYLIFVIFSSHRQFFNNFSPHSTKSINRDKTDVGQKCVNYDKTDFDDVALPVGGMVISV